MPDLSDYQPCDLSAAQGIAFAAGWGACVWLAAVVAFLI